MLTYNETGFGDYNLSVALGRYGVYHGDSFAIEGRAGIGIGDDSKTVRYAGFDIDTKVEVDNMLGLYAVKIVPAGDKVDVYGFAGITRMTVTATASIGSISVPNSDSETDLSFDAGANIKLGEKTALNIEYANYYDKGDVTIDALSVGATVYY